MLRNKLIKIGAKVVRHGRTVTFQLAEVAIPKPLFAEILRLIDGLRTMPAKRKMVIGARFRSPTSLSILTDQTSNSYSSRQSIANLEFGLSVLEMTAVSYVIWGMSI